MLHRVHANHRPRPRHSRKAADDEEAVRLAATLGPDLILMDLRMPGTGGIEATRKILKESPTTAIVVLTMVEEDDSVFAAMHAGARGYLLKGADREEMLLAIRAAARGEPIFGAGIAKRLMRYFSSPAQEWLARSGEGLFPELTERERQILELIAAGKNNQTIAQELFLSLKTVRNYVSNNVQQAAGSRSSAGHSTRQRCRIRARRKNPRRTRASNAVDAARSYDHRRRDPPAGPSGPP